MDKAIKPAITRLSPEEFTIRAIQKLRTPPYLGINPIISGFNNAFREYFGKDADPIATTRALAECGVLVIVPAKRGVTIYTAADAKQAGIKPPKPPREVLSDILK